MKLIFLDFDGVISTFDNKWHISDEKINHIKNIVDNTNAKLVITSSWKVGYDNVSDFINNHFNLKNTSDMMMWLKLNIYDITDNEGPSRGDEIKRYIDSHSNIETYIIIDDDSDMLDEQLNNFVQTDTYEGITIREEKICINLLNYKYVNKIRLNYENRFKYMYRYYNQEFDDYKLPDLNK